MIHEVVEQTWTDALRCRYCVPLIDEDPNQRACRAAPFPAQVGTRLQTRVIHVLLVID